MVNKVCYLPADCYELRIEPGIVARLRDDILKTAGSRLRLPLNRAWAVSRDE
ncbi:hypothetical protein LP7551_02695 [Roseibium album]|nr:hypothetical protein LP7551_02695 [Roseibium album]